MDEVITKSAIELVGCMRNHACDNKSFKVKDKVLWGIGFNCSCGKWFGLALRDFKRTSHEISEDLSDQLCFKREEFALVV